MWSKLSFILSYTHRFKWWYTGGVLFLLLTIWVSVTIPEYVQQGIDSIAGGRDAGSGLMLRAVLTILVMSLVLMVARTLSRILFFIPGRLIERQLKGEMFRKLASFGKDYYDKNSSGSIISRINNDINGVRMITGFGLLQIFNIAFSLSLTPYKMWMMSPRLTLYTIIPIFVVFVIVRFGMAYMVKNTHLRMEALQRLSGRIISFLSGNAVIKSYNIHRWAEEKTDEENVNVYDYGLRISWVRSFVMPLMGGMEQILKVVVLMAGGMLVIKTDFTIGQLTEFIAYAALLTHPISGLGWVLTAFQQGFVGISSLQTIMNRKGVDDDRKALAPEMRTRLFDNGLQVRHLSYRYHNDEDYVLSDISFDLKPGQVMGITGPVGAGKSTLINCINGYLKPESGQLWFGSLDAARLRGDDIRQVVRTVGQEVFLFSDTIENNIAFGEGLVPDDERVGDVLYRSAMADEIERFPKGRRTMVGEKGIMLSGGQKQRISLARALYSPGKLLILDDVFSAVDTETERFLIRELFKFRQGGLIIISNRMSVLERTDFNIVLEGGRLTAMGTHQQLLETSDFYRNTHDIQEGGKR